MAGEALSEVFAAFGVKFDTKELDKGEDVLQRSMKTLKEFGKVIAGALIVRQVKNFVISTMTIGDEISRTAQQLGLATAELQRFRFAARMTGVDNLAFNTSLGQLQQKAYDAAHGSQDMRRAFTELGVDVLDSSGNLRTASDLFMLVADGLEQTENSSVRTALSMKIFGESGRRLLPMLTQGSEGLRRMHQDARDLGGGMSEGAIEASGELAGTIVRLSHVFQGLRSRIAVVVLPIVNKLTTAFIKLVSFFLSVTKHSQLFKAALILLGGVATAVAVKFLAMWISALWPLALAALGIVGIILVIDELMVTIRGGDSLLRRFIDSLYGVGATTEALEGVVQLWRDFVELLEQASDFIIRITQGAGIVSSFYGAFEIERETDEEFVERSNKEQRERLARQGREARQPRGAEEFWRPEATPLEDVLAQAQGLRAGTVPIRVGAEPATAGPTARIRAVPGPTTINAPSDINVNITAQGADPEQVARLAQRHMEEGLERQRRQTIIALEPVEIEGST